MAEAKRVKTPKEFASELKHSQLLGLLFNAFRRVQLIL
jgi:hypothetical protein